MFHKIPCCASNLLVSFFAMKNYETKTFWSDFWDRQDSGKKIAFAILESILCNKFSLKKTKLVLNFLIVHYFNFIRLYDSGLLLSNKSRILRPIESFRIKIYIFYRIDSYIFIVAEIHFNHVYIFLEYHLQYKRSGWSLKTSITKECREGCLFWDRMQGCQEYTDVDCYTWHTCPQLLKVGDF